MKETIQQRTEGRRLRLAPIAVGAATLGLGLMALVPGAARAASTVTTACNGTAAAPASLAGGSYQAVEVTGLCEVNEGQVVVQNEITITPGSALIADFGKNHSSGKGTSGLWAGAIDVGAGSTAILGCKGTDQPCEDDPNQADPSLSSNITIAGDLTADAPLGLDIHNANIGGNVSETGGGGGLSCTPTGPFAAIPSPVFSDVENSNIGGDLTFSGISTCWLGAFRNKIVGTVTDTNNTMADPDANEILTNGISGNIICTGNSPAVQYGDSGGRANTVGGTAVGECAFGVTAPDPAPAPASAGSPAVAAGPPQAISIPGQQDGFVATTPAA